MTTHGDIIMTVTKTIIAMKCICAYSAMHWCLFYNGDGTQLFLMVKRSRVPAKDRDTLPSKGILAFVTKLIFLTKSKILHLLQNQFLLQNPKSCLCYKIQKLAFVTKLAFDTKSRNSAKQNFQGSFKTGINFPHILQNVIKGDERLERKYPVD